MVRVEHVFSSDLSTLSSESLDAGLLMTVCHLCPCLLMTVFSSPDGCVSPVFSSPDGCVSPVSSSANDSVSPVFSSPDDCVSPVFQVGAIPANAMDDGQWSQGLISAVSPIFRASTTLFPAVLATHLTAFHL